MGGSGGNSNFTRPSAEVESLRAEVRKNLEDQELIADKNQFLAEQLVDFNQRDTNQARQRLEEVEETLTELGHDIQKFLYGGSIAKHTYVNGLSDIDALVFLTGVQPGTPREVLQNFAAALRGRLSVIEVEAVNTGNMAVTIIYRDGSQLQLLPAIERESHTVIADEGGQGWRSVRPHKFTEKLSKVNADNGGGVVPVIKLAKSLLDKLPPSQHLIGYHVEAIAVDAFKNYDGARDRASMLSHLIGHAARSVLNPTGDITGQSVHIDQNLGASNSEDRRRISGSLTRIHQRLSGATSLSNYRDIFESDRL